jgi:hypothetical protein
MTLVIFCKISKIKRNKGIASKSKNTQPPDVSNEMASLTDEPLNPKRTNSSTNASSLGLSLNRPKQAGDILNHHYCETCKIWVPPLSVHCETCNHCVKDFAGHNFMVSNDIGLRNNKHYIYLCLNLSIVFGIWFLEGVWTLSLISAEGSFDEIFEDSIGLW